MARRKKTVEVETEVEAEVEIPQAKVEEVTEEFILQDVSDTGDRYETIVEEGILDLDKTEVEAAIEVGEDIALVEEFKQASAPVTKRNRTSVDTRADAAQILKDQKQREIDEKNADQRKNQTRQRMARVKPVISQIKKNNGIRTSSGLFSR